jgi:hypothetical protein
MSKIPVILISGSLSEITSEGLDALLDQKAVMAFQRSSGWAIVGRDELRGTRGAGNGSWKDRKAKLRPARELVLLPRPTGPATSAVCDVVWEADRIVLNHS